MHALIIYLRISFVDREARNDIPANKIILLVVKYAYGYNYHRLWSLLINNTRMEERWPRCNKVENGST